MVKGGTNLEFLLKKDMIDSSGANENSRHSETRHSNAGRTAQKKFREELTERNGGGDPEEERLRSL